jgi:nucleotide-binding universal stress UspA family protein
LEALNAVELLRDDEEENMFKHILLPTDGSKLSEVAIQKTVDFAKSIGARVTGFHVMPEFHVFTYRTEMLEDTREEFARDSRAHAEKYLAVIEKAAKDAGVQCKTASTVSDHPYEAIIQAAKEGGCDLIMMASHGRKGVQGMLLGSETHKVLTHSGIPVLVYR